MIEASLHDAAESISSLITFRCCLPQLDGVNRAMDVIKAANEQMVSLRSEFENMHELCRKAGESGKLVFDAYPNLKKVNRCVFLTQINPLIIGLSRTEATCHRAVLLQVASQPGAYAEGGGWSFYPYPASR